MKINTKWLPIVSSILLLLAIPSGIWPYGYYIFLRWVVSISAALIAYTCGLQGNKFWMLVFGLVTILFNPIVPVYLSKSQWVYLDLATAYLFVRAIYITKK